MKKLIIIAGPTGVGKTDLSLELSRRIDGEIVSCDSMQIYRGMDIGTAKATAEEREMIPHHLIDVVSPFETFNVSDYKVLAEEAIRKIQGRGNVPIMVGGTGLYIDSVIRDFSFTEGGYDLSFRDHLEKLAEEKGKAHVFSMLKEKDPKAAENIHMNNLKRVIRALEVYHVTGKPFSGFKDERKLNPHYDVHYFYLNREREMLYRNIDLRVDRMMEEGLLEEVKHLKGLGLNESFVSMKGIGYKEILSHLDGEISLPDAAELIKKRSRNYAKRQLTWFRHHEYAAEISRDDKTDEEILHILENV